MKQKIKLKDWIDKTIQKRAMHFTLIDPDPKKIKDIDKKIKHLKEYGTDAIMIGGSSDVKKSSIDKVIKAARNNNLPTILFPGNKSGISRKADAIFFMSLLNSRSCYWITGVQARAAIPIKKWTKLETLSMGYIIFKPGGKVGEVGKANLIERNDKKQASSYAAAAELLGMSLVYLEGGSGVPQPLPTSTVKAVRKNISIPLIVGGGIRNEKQAKAIVKAGANIIVTGTITEENFNSIEDIIKAVIKS